LERALPLCSNLLKEGGLVYAESGLALEFAEAKRRNGWRTGKSSAPTRPGWCSIIY
jgi:hypothetical protein